MNLQLQGKRALVSGANRGIGRATAVELAQLGASVTLVARAEKQLQELQAILSNDGTQKHLVLATDPAQPADLLHQLHADLDSNGPYHILVSQNSDLTTEAAAVASVESYLQSFQQHLLINQQLVQQLLPGMKQQQYGRLINILSTAVKEPIAQLGVTNTVEAAVAAWAKSLSVELAKYGITVNNILPGITDTQRLTDIIQLKAKLHGISLESAHKMEKAQIPAERYAEPQEVAHAIAFLASPAAAYINGVNLPVDGGRTASL